MAASETTLNKIHEVFATYLLDLLTKTVPVHNEEGDVVDEVPYRVSAAELGVITKFLKDNNISFVGGGDEEDEELNAIRERAKEAARRQGFTQADIDAATQALDYRTH